MFLVLAQVGKAEVLVTGDADLLSMHETAFSFQILPADQLIEQ